LNPKATGRLGIGERLAYAAPSFALAAVGIPVYVHLPKFYTDVVGVDVALLGAMILGIRIFDAFTDPAIGLLSDRTRSRHGRRRPYVLGAVGPLALCFYLLFQPPALGGAAAATWFGVNLFLVFLFATLVKVPYDAWGPELSFDYDERTSLLGMRDGFLLGGTVVAASSPVLIAAALGLGEGAADQRALFFWVAVLYAALLVASCVACVLRLRERSPRPPSAAGHVLRGLFETRRNRPFLILLAAYTVSAFGSNLPATLILYYVEYVLGSKLANLFLLEYFVTGIAFLPLWIAAARRFDKKQTWIASICLNTGAFAGVFFLGPGDAALYGVLVFLSGIGLGATLALPSSMQADVIDYDELLSGERREGQYLGLWSVSTKLAAALGVGVALPVLGQAGYVPNQEQTEAVKTTLRVLYALVPSLCNLLALGIALLYPITRARHAEIRAALR
jgi:GPH family glycoside/pentoside/hexuronide:cation symporter